jgi:hypothetical protein
MTLTKMSDPTPIIGAMMKTMKICPRHGGAFDCTPFCDICEGNQEYDPTSNMSCVVPNCIETIPSEIWLEELGFCVEHSNAYFNQELDPYTLEEIA